MLLFCVYHTERVNALSFILFQIIVTIIGLLLLVLLQYYNMVV